MNIKIDSPFKYRILNNNNSNALEIVKSTTSHKPIVAVEKTSQPQDREERVEDADEVVNYQLDLLHEDDGQKYSKGNRGRSILIMRSRGGRQYQSYDPAASSTKSSKVTLTTTDRAVSQLAMLSPLVGRTDDPAEMNRKLVKLICPSCEDQIMEDGFYIPTGISYASKQY